MISTTLGRIMIDGVLMMDHLPECRKVVGVDDNGTTWVRLGERCVCDQLRACEQRVLDAAREAVDSMVIETAGNSAATVNQALAAIDALREKP